MSRIENILKIIADNADSDAVLPKSVKVVEFAVGEKGTPLYTIPDCADIVIVMSENASESNHSFEVYCRGLLYGQKSPSEAYTEFERLKQANYFTIKLASTNCPEVVRFNGKLFRISYGNLAPLDSLDNSSLWYTSHISFSCFDYDERFARGFYLREPIDAVFYENLNIPEPFAQLGEGFNDICKVYRKLVRNHNYLGNFYYLLTGDVNKNIYLFGVDIRLNMLDKYLALLDECIAGLYALLFEQGKGRNINIDNLLSKIVDARFSLVTKETDAEIGIDIALDRKVKSIISSSKKSQCFKHLARHRNQRVAHFGSKFLRSEETEIESVAHISRNFTEQVTTYGWALVLPEIKKHLLYCGQAIMYIDECLNTIAEGCEIFNIKPVRHYRDIESYPRHSAVWDLYDILPKEKFDIPWINKGSSIPS